ncbi:MAG: phosphate signaling complex protein PhoU [Lachnospiraceae bacterium]|nr:phosphate signaling complex protein PhoU [Lachnospiraceae bacterium]
MSPRTTFENELKELHNHVTDMAWQVEKNYEQLFDALARKDEQEIIRIKEDDKEINQRQREVESKCLLLITRQQPVIGDLRVVTASLKVVTDIERVGDHLADMAELFLRMGLKEVSVYSQHLMPMAQAARKMVKMAVNAFVNRNEQVAREVIAGDDEVDELFNKVKNDLIEILKKETRDVDDCIDALMIAKYLEKIGDHAVNISEWELFQETGNISKVRVL